MIVVTLLTVMTASAQHNAFDTNDSSSRGPRVSTEWGIGIGGTFTNIKKITPSDVKLNPRFGFQGHLDFSLCIGRNFAIETEIAYEGGSIVAATAQKEHKIRTRTIDFPVLLSLRFLGGRIRLNAGPLFNIMSKAEYTSDGQTQFFGNVHPTWNLAAGVAVGLSRHFLLEARYVLPLRDNLNQFLGEEFTTSTSKITAGVVLIF